MVEFDADLATRISALQQRRKDLALLPSAERLAVTDEVAALLDDLRALGLSERSVALERDAWILLSVAYPELVAAHAELKQQSSSTRLSELVEQLSRERGYVFPTEN